MQNKKVIILAVLSIFAVISLVRGIMTPSKHRQAAGPAAAVSDVRNPPAQKAVNVSMQRSARRTVFKSWKRNPFAPVGSGNTSALVLNGIIWNKDKPKAMIGDMIVARGDKVGDNKVVDIKPDRVILNDGINNFELKMEK